jgi:leucyl aminopeptidase
LVGIGKEEKLHLNTIRVATSKAIHTLREKKITSDIALILPSSLPIKAAPTNGQYYVVPDVAKDAKVGDTELLDAVTRIIVLANHQWDKYLKSEDETSEENKTGADDQSTAAEKKPAINPTAYMQSNKAVAGGKPYIRSLTIGTAKDITNGSDITRTAQIITECTLFARELGNERADIITTQYMEDTSKAVAKKYGLKVKVVSHDELVKDGYTLITAVGQAARHKARLVVLEYSGDSANADDRIAIVGKGICYDTGGLNLKPTGSMEDMHLDMSGSAAVLCTMKAIAELKLPVNVVGTLCLAENVIDSLSYKPHAIIATRRGTVQVDNTDAEGRLALADGILYTQENYHPKQLQTIATLTGAMIMSLGHDFAGVFTTDDVIGTSLQASGYRTHEHVWRLPLVHEHHAENMKNEYSDLKSTGGRAAGSQFAASFLSRFVDDNVRYAHLDIAGMQLQPKPRLWFGSGGVSTYIFCTTKYTARVT